MIPVIAIVGRPNVGKSTLFNRLTKRRDAIVANLSGLTRDRQYGEGRYLDKAFIVIDTGGIGETEGGVDDNMTQQSMQAVADADIVFFMVDGRAGLTPTDEVIAQQLRNYAKKIYLLVNKVDAIDADVARADFYQTGFESIFPIAAVHGRGVSRVMDEVLAPYADNMQTEDQPEQRGIKLAIVGRPNVGKSTLVNRMLGEERVIVYDMPGTTRDSIYIPLERLGQQYTLIDTAGVRKRGKVKQTVEKFSVVKTLQAIDDAHVVIVVLDAQEAVTEQDMHLLQFVMNAGRALVIAINKWDGLDQAHKENIRMQIRRRLEFAQFARLRFISALHGTGVGDLFPYVDEAHQTAMQSVSTSKLTQILQAAVQKHQPPLVSGRRIKLRYAHQGGKNPLTIVIHGNQTDAVPASYQRYLSNSFRDALKIVGAPLYIQFKTGENPYKDKRNQLTPRQIRRRKRLRTHNKK